MTITISLNPELDLPALAKSFHESGRLQIRDFLKTSDARKVLAALGRVEWNLVMNDRDRHIDLPVSQLPNLGLERIRAAVHQALGRAADEFQYVYENYPIADAAASGSLKLKELKAIFEFMNSESVRNTLETITGHATDFCDMQATKYGPGHVLTPHDDGVEGKNRKFAYVLGLTQGWSSVWGGQLQFITDDGRVEQSFVPAFNTLSIFAVPALHHVSQVASFAPKPRLSLTGWFRCHDS